MATLFFDLHSFAPSAARLAPLPDETRLVTGAVRTFHTSTLHSLCVRHGRVWITIDGDHEDHVLEAGDVFVPRVPGRVVIEALTPAAVEIDHA